jgi:hypothetical protein
MEGAKLWLIGKYVGDGPGMSIAWEFQGLVSTEEQAVAACRDDHYFIAPCVVGEVLPDASEEWVGSYYPLAAKEV